MVRKNRTFIVLICITLIIGCSSNKKPTCTLAPSEQISSGSDLTYLVDSGESEGGYATAIFVQNNFAYIGVGKTLTIFDVTDPSDPTQVGNILLLNNSDSIFVVDDYVFVSDNHWPKRQSVVSVADPQNPILIECEEGISLSLANASLIRNHVFAPWQNDRGHSIYEIINGPDATKLVEVSSYQSSVPPTFRLLPEPRVGAARPRTVTDVTIVSQYVYVAENLWGGDSYYNGRVRIFDVSDQMELESVAEFNMPNNGSATQLLADNNYMVIADRTQEGGYSAIILDIADPKNPEEISRITGLEVPIAIYDSFAYFIKVTDGLATVRVRDLADPNEIVQFDWNITDYGWVFGWSGDMVIFKNHAYFLDSEVLHIVDVTEPFSPHKITDIRLK